MSRVDNQIQRVLMRLKDKGEHDYTRDQILFEMNNVQTELCRDYFAYKADATLTLIVGTSEYTLASTIYKIKEIIEPTTWRHRIKILHDSQEWAEIVRTTTIQSDQPLYAYTWNRVLRLYPIPSSADTISIISFLLPSADLVIGGDPVIGIEWDEALMLGTYSKFVGGDAIMLYEREAKKVMGQSVKESVNGDLRVRHSSDEIGF